MEKRQIFFDEYFESIFNESNDFSKSQFEFKYLHYENEFGKFLPKNGNAKILDIGCGCGHFLYFLEKKHYKNYYGIDISSQQIEFCKENISNLVEVADTFEFLKNKENEYEIIIISAVLEHIPKVKTIDLLKLIYKALTKDGYLLIEVPNMSNLFSMDLRYKDFTHEAGFTEMSIKQVLKIAKFDKIHISSTSILGNSLKNKVHRLLVRSLHKFLKFLYYIQMYSVPKQLGKLLIVAALKR